MVTTKFPFPNVLKLSSHKQLLLLQRHQWHPPATKSSTSSSLSSESTNRGRVERLQGSPIVPSSPEDPQTGVSSKDIVISPESGISARLYLPKLTSSSSSDNRQKLPVLLYFHGGAFCLMSACSFLDHRYLNLIVSHSNVLAVSVEYRLAPEHPTPAAYDDAWEALQWLFSPNSDDWLQNHEDLNRVFVGGDSSGGNIAHNVSMRVGAENAVKNRGAVLSFPYFWGSERIGLEEGRPDVDLTTKVWELVSPGSANGVDDPLINPFAPEAPSLAGLGCDRVLVVVSGGDTLQWRGRVYVSELKNSGWKGEVELVDIEGGEPHCFQIFNPETENAKVVFQRFAEFLNQ